MRGRLEVNVSVVSSRQAGCISAQVRRQASQTEACCGVACFQTSQAGSTWGRESGGTMCAHGRLKVSAVFNLRACRSADFLQIPLVEW